MPVLPVSATSYSPDDELRVGGLGIKTHCTNGCKAVVKKNHHNREEGSVTLKKASQTTDGRADRRRRQPTRLI